MSDREEEEEAPAGLSAAPAGEDLPGPREGVRALRHSRLSGRATPRRGRGARGRASSHGRGARLPSWSDIFGSLAPQNAAKT